jgi:septum formation protein
MDLHAFFSPSSCTVPGRCKQDTRTIVSEATPALHLASASPRRAEILAALGVSYSVGGVDIDEQQLAGEPPDEMVLRLASEKAAAARRTHSLPVLAADTVVVVDDTVFGKPQDQDDALAMLASLSGRSHQVMTGVAIAWDDGQRTALSVNEVCFRQIGPDEALAYWQSGEPRGKAGAYAIQGLGGVFVKNIQGSYSGVVGLPVFETAALMAAVGIDVIKRVVTE